MNFPLKVARRYFLSRKKKNFINVISIISMLVVATGTAALIIVLSVFNGLEGLLKSLYGSFDPEVKIEAKVGKSFVAGDSLINAIKAIEGVEIVTEVIEDNALIKYDDAQMIVRVKGVSANFMKQQRLADHIVAGVPLLQKDHQNFAIIGQGIKFALGMSSQNLIKPVQLYYPKNLKKATLNVSKLYTIKSILPGAFFAIEKTYDDSYVFVPLKFARELFNYDNRLTALEVKMASGFDQKAVQELLKQALGDEFRVLNTEQLHSDLYKILKLEKLIVFIIFSLIIAIASINIYFSLSMLVLDKKKDINMLVVMGASSKLIRRIFLFEGSIISLTGALLGLFIGLAVCFIQQYFGLIGMGMESSLLDAYPVEVHGLDLVYTVICIIFITILASFPPARVATRSFSSAEL